MQALTGILLVVIILLLLILLYFVVKRGRIEPKDIELAWARSGLSDKIAQLEVYAQDIRREYRTLEQMLRVPKGRGYLGEIALEQILSDELPQDMFGIRKEILGKVPDAHIRSTVGVICIDSKFPLENYRKMVETEDPQEKEKFKNQFLKNVQTHLDKIASDYVHLPGSAGFAFAFIPSESVYHFLVTEAYDTLRKYAVEKGVQVVSPLTLSHKIELIKAGIYAQRLSEQAESVRQDIIRLSERFREIDEGWGVLCEHLRNAANRAGEVNEAYRKLREEFDRISKFSGGETSGRPA